MTMELLEYRKDFLEDVKSTAVNQQEGTVASFVDVAARQLVEAEVLPDFASCFYAGTGKRNKKLRVDGYCLDEFDYTLNLILADFDGNDDPKTLIKTDAVRMFSAVEAFIAESRNGLLNHLEISNPVYDLVDLINEKGNQIRKYSLFLFSDSIISERLTDLKQGDIEGIPINYHVWDISRFFKVCFAETGREELEVDFTKYIKNGIPCVEASAAATEISKSYLCVIPGKVLADIYDEYGSRLLEGNVRSFLSTRVKVNKKIRETILTQPDMFFAYNNGISITATNVVISENKTGKYLSYAKDMQIVNGGQTTASLSNTRHKDKVSLEDIFVQMKLTQVDSESANEIIPQISKSSNSQNKVSEADFFSNHPFHIRMETISRRLYAPSVGGGMHNTHWFYERARGQYFHAQMRMTKSEKNKFQIQNPKKQVISKTELAKARNSWRCLPYVVSKGTQANFVSFAAWIDPEWESREADFNESFYQECVALVILFHYIEKLVSAQPWYQSGYRAQIVTYSIAMLVHLIKSQYKNGVLDLKLIWNKQTIPEILHKQLEIITKAVFDCMTDPERDTINVTQWCKREKCWEMMKKLDIHLIPEIVSVLVSKEEVASDKKEARTEQKMLNGIEAQMFVVNLGQNYWAELHNFGKNKNLLTLPDFDILKAAEAISGTKLPNAYQCQKLQELRNRMISEGFSE